MISHASDFNHGFFGSFSSPLKIEGRNGKRSKDMWGQGGMLKNLDRSIIWYASLDHVGFHSGNKLMKNKDIHSFQSIFCN